MQFNEADKKRIRWATRRGLLELDIILARFMNRDFNALSDEELTQFVKLLDLPDQDLFALFNKTKNNNDLVDEKLLEKIRAV